MEEGHVAVGGKRNVTAQRDTTLRCKGWRQEAIPRLLENALEVGERPEELVIYAGSAQAARDWDSVDRIVAALQRMEEDQTLVGGRASPSACSPRTASRRWC